MGYSILVAEDEPSIAASLRFLMQQFDSNVRVAHDGPSAIAMIEEKKPDLLLLDIIMPGCDGFHVLEEIRANPESEHVKVLVLSAKGHDADRNRALELGVMGYLTKPFSTRELVERVGAYVQGKNF